MYNLQNCLAQIFDLNQVDVSKNLLLSDMFIASMRNIFVHLDSRIGMYPLCICGYSMYPCRSCVCMCVCVSVCVYLCVHVFLFFCLSVYLHKLW